MRCGAISSCQLAATGPRPRLRSAVGNESDCCKQRYSTCPDIVFITCKDIIIIVNFMIFQKHADYAYSHSSAESETVFNLGSTHFPLICREIQYT